MAGCCLHCYIEWLKVSVTDLDTGLLSAGEVRGGRAAVVSVHLVVYRETV
jgi:hypothetical protein